MKELHDRINRIINAEAFRRALEDEEIDFIEFQCTWAELSKGSFDNLPAGYRRAVLKGEEELLGAGSLALA